MYDTIIIGAGPAGLSAAGVLGKYQKVLVIDEYFRVGGRLPGQLYEEEKGKWWNGLEVTKNLEADVTDSDILTGASVYDVEYKDDYTVYTTSGTFETECLIIATGAREKSSPLPGWELPGVMTVGAAQVLTNVSRVKPGDSGVIIGINPLSMVIGLELGYADIDVAKICMPPANIINRKTPEDALETLMSLGSSAPSQFISFGASVASRAKSFHRPALKLFPKSGVTAMGLPISVKEKVIRINGDEQVESVTIQKTDADGNLIHGSVYDVECDFVCISDGLAPLSEVGSLLNLKHVYSEPLGGYVPLHSRTMRTELSNLYVAGNITGIENAKTAILQGEAAAYNILGHQGMLTNTLGKIDWERKHAKVKFHPGLTKGKEAIESLWQQNKNA